jgi:ElaB/YqjD/DUF883 family membrane-anchored ribosome-binding protein
MHEARIETVQSELKNLVQEAQALFDEASGVTGAKAEELRARGMHMLDSAMHSVHELQSAVTAAGRKVVHDTDHYVHQHPWQAIGIAGAVGVVVGLLIARR